MKQKIAKTSKKRQTKKKKFELCRKNRKIDYSDLVNLETSNPDFLRNSIADSSVNWV